MTNWEQVYLKEIVFGIGSQVLHTIRVSRGLKQPNVSPQSNTSWSQEGGIIGCQGALPATSDVKSVTYIFALGKPEKDVVVTVGNTGLQENTFISKSKHGIEEVDSNPPVVGLPSLRLGIN